MVVKRFEIIKRLYLSKALLKMARGGVHPPHPPGSAPGPWYATKRLFASFATAKNLQEAPMAKNIMHKYGMGGLWGAPHRAS